MSISTIAAGIIIVGVSGLLALIDKEKEEDRKAFESEEGEAVR